MSTGPNVITDNNMTCTINVVGAVAIEETIVIAYTIIFEFLSTRGTLLNRFLRLSHHRSREQDGNRSAENKTRVLVS